MLAHAFTAAMLGIDGYVVRVEADSAPGSPALTIIGLPDRALNEARERVRCAIHNSGFAYPAGRLLVNLSPADIRIFGYSRRAMQWHPSNILRPTTPFAPCNLKISKTIQSPKAFIIHIWIIAGCNAFIPQIQTFAAETRVFLRKLR